MKKNVAMNNGLIFVGQRGPNGDAVEYLNGFPARDITGEEIGHFNDEQIAAMIASNLYQWAGSTRANATIVIDTANDEEMTDGN